MEHFDLIEMIEGVLNSYRIMVEQKQAKVELKEPGAGLISGLMNIWRRR